VASLGILHRSGNGYRSACPLCHSTNREVFSIYDDCRRWHCFRCHEGGDVFALASHIWKDKNFPEVAYSLGDMFGIARPTATVSGTSNPPAHKHVVNAGSVRLVTVKVGG
jgi:DNA primase